MSEKEYKEKCSNMFARNAVLLHRIDELEKGIAQFQKDNEVLYKTVAEKNEQIKRLKCCENCKNHYWHDGELDCDHRYSCYDNNYDK